MLTDNLNRAKSIFKSRAMLQAQLDAIQASVKSSNQQIASLSTMLADIASAKNRDMDGESLSVSGLVARAARLARPDVLPPALRQKRDSRTFDEDIEALNQLEPAIFPIWLRLFENARRSYYEQREASCSHRTHKYALLFGYYLEIYASGKILDIGCGPHGKPSYLSTWPSSAIAGIDPLKSLGEPNFELARGFNEFLPWDDASFDTVLSGTSLDHVLSIEKSMSEVVRVLKPGGRYLVWLASIKGAPPYQPGAPNFAPIDDFHLFHFDRSWIEPIFERYFNFLDVTVIAQPGFDHVFYCMQPR